MALFKGIEKEQVGGGGNYITPGTYSLEVMEVKTFESQQKKGRTYFCVDFSVLSSTNPEHDPGQAISWLVNMEQPSALSNVKGFALALSGDMKDTDVNEEAMEHLVSSDNPAAGTRMKANAYAVKTRAGNDFTKVAWSFGG
jgi:hypothetical protein